MGRREIEMKKTLIDELPFEIDARIPLQLGRESISSSMVALSELVKNSYDADATKVTLDFLNLGTNKAALVISDNGIGMNQDSFKKNWLRIGTTNKTRNIRSRKFKRVLTGAKGLGRLGVDRLSKDLILHTKTKAAKTAYELTVHWNKYEKEGISLSDVKHSFYECEIPINDDFGIAFNKKSDEGTRLILDGLKDNWDRSSLLQVRQQLSFLVSPFSDAGDFEIEIKSGFEDVDGIVNSESVLEAAIWKIKAKLQKNGKVTIKYEDCVRKKLYSLNSIPWHEFMSIGDEEKPVCGPLNFSMYYIPWDDPKHLDKPSFDKKDIRAFMGSNQGIRIYRDYFRVRPYGEPDSTGDWLDLSSRAI
ncbi:putative two-component system sensor histidine kinase, putative heat shock protein, partial [hydrothermal vent metagenome]